VTVAQGIFQSGWACSTLDRAVQHGSQGRSGAIRESESHPKFCPLPYKRSKKGKTSKRKFDFWRLKFCWVDVSDFGLSFLDWLK
jgi:hypothetical protein